MNINHFAYFVEAVRENSITKAAESLFISQSTISKAIKCLEQAYNTELIDRKARNFKLTSAGEIFYNKGLPLLHPSVLLLPGKPLQPPGTVPRHYRCQQPG